MATMASTCMMWFCTTSRRAPTLSCKEPRVETSKSSAIVICTDSTYCRFHSGSRIVFAKRSRRICCTDSFPRKWSIR